MYKFLVFLLIVPALFANVDTDMDGVDDIVDQCPGTLITDLVDIKGCGIESLVSPHHYDIIVGASYSQMNSNSNAKTDTYTKSLSADYYYKNYSAQISTSHSTSKSASLNDNGLGDTTLAAGYIFNIQPNLSGRVGAGIVLPTYKSTLNNNNTDYIASLNLTYTMDKINLFAGYNFTMTNDDDIPNTVVYQNAHGMSAGVGYSVNEKLYVNGSYSRADSTSKNTEDTESISMMGSYSLDQHWFTSASYAYGLSDSTSDHYLSANLGYRF
ncbi:MAG: transporter [Sulfuricurvum sp.]|jgi:hypothetical protein